MASPIGDLLKGSNKTALFGLVSLTAIIAFGAGDLLGQSRHSSTVEQAISTVVKKDSLAPKRNLLERAAIEAVLKATGDRWSNYFPTQSAGIFDEELQGRYSGVGLWLRKSASGVLEIASVPHSSPASLAGIKVRDLLLSVDGTDMSTSSIATAVAALRGAPNSRVVLVLERDQQKYSVTLKRSGDLSGDVVASQIAPNILYLQISAITDQAVLDVKTALKKFPHAKGIILDLRDNPGGLIHQAVNLTSYFLSDGVVVSFSRKGDDDVVLSASNSNPDLSPMTVLINKSTASSAEVIAGALQDRNRAVIIGETSYGKGTVQEVVPLMDGSQLEVTIGRYRTPSGNIIDGIGIRPDLVVGENQEISKAIQVLSGLASLDGSKYLRAK